MTKNHKVYDMVSKHLKALYEEMAAGNYCEICTMQTLVASGIGSIMADAKSIAITEEFMRDCLRIALDAELNGKVENHAVDTKPAHKTGMH